MNRYRIVLFAALMLGLAVVGCAQREYSAARVQLPPNASEQSQLMSYAKSAAFATDVRARAATNLPTSFEITVRLVQNTSLLELGATSEDPQVAAQAANVMAAVLKEFAAKHKFAPVELVAPATPRPNR